MVVGVEAAVGQEEDVVGVEAGGEVGDGAAVVGVGGGGGEAGGLPEEAAEEAGELADEEAGTAALVDALLAGLLDEGLEPGGQRGGSKPRGSAISSIRARRNCSRAGSASPRARLTLPSPSRARRSASAGSEVTPCSIRTAASSAVGQGVEPDDPAARDDRVELDLGRGADQDQDGAVGGFLQGLQEGVGGLVVEVVGVVDDRHPAARRASA